MHVPALPGSPRRYIAEKRQTAAAVFIETRVDAQVSFDIAQRAMVEANDDTPRRVRPHSVSSMSQLLLAGWCMLADSCPTCGVGSRWRASPSPLLRCRPPICFIVVECADQASRGLCRCRSCATPAAPRTSASTAATTWTQAPSAQLGLEACLDSMVLQRLLQRWQTAASRQPARMRMRRSRLAGSYTLAFCSRRHPCAPASELNWSWRARVVLPGTQRRQAAWQRSPPASCRRCAMRSAPAARQASRSVLSVLNPHRTRARRPAPRLLG